LGRRVYTARCRREKHSSPFIQLDAKLENLRQQSEMPGLSAVVVMDQELV